MLHVSMIFLIFHKIQIYLYFFQKAIDILKYDGIINA